MKVIMLVVIASLIFPYSLFAAPPEVTQPPASSEPVELSAAPNIAKDGDYSPTAKNIYLGTAIGTLLVGGAAIALAVAGRCSGNSNQICFKEANTAAYSVGGGMLAISTVLWILYAREKGKEPTSTVGFELDKGKSVITAHYRF